MVSRTENPQIKRPIDQEETLEILMISHTNCAERGNARHHDATRGATKVSRRVPPSKVEGSR